MKRFGMMVLALCLAPASMQAQQAEQAGLTGDFQRAFSACMAGRGYQVK